MNIPAEKTAAASLAPSPAAMPDFARIAGKPAARKPASSSARRWLPPLFAALLLFARSAAGGTFATLHQFATSPNDIGIGRQGPSQACDAKGNIYGTTYAGGKYGNGTIYRLSTDGAFTTLHSFSPLSGGANADGCNPVGGLVTGPDGNFYGTTYVGGSNGTGAVFQITPAGVFSPLYSFTALDGNGDNGDGANPSAALIVGPDQALYGTAYYGGANAVGTIFRITTGGALNLLYSFQDGSDGAVPATALTVGPNGVFYGTSQSGGLAVGTAFQMTVANGVLDSFNTIHTFGGGDDAVNPSSLTLGADGNLYGTSSGGGTNSQGTVFQMTPTNPANVNVIYSFQNPDPGTENNSGGYQPFAPLILAPDGNFYGVANVGGNAGVGEIFEIDTGGSLTPLFSFQGGNGGIGPVAPLVLAPNGDFYGTTSSGGKSFQGTLFRLSLASSTEYSVQAGVYAGLFGTNDFLTLTMSASGKFTGKFVLNGVSDSLSGAFNPFGQYTGNIGRASIPVSLSLGVNGNAGTLGSYIVTGTIGGLSVTAFHAAYGKGETAAEAGKYTVLIAPTDNDPAFPQGTGYATLTVGRTGSVSMAGKLANGSAFSCAGVLVGGGPNNSNQYLVFDLTSAFELDGSLPYAVLADSDFAGSLNWTVNPSRSHYYGAGFATSESAQAILYAAPGRDTEALSFPAGQDNGSLQLSAGGLATAIDENVTLSDQNKITDDGPNAANKIKLTINAASGTFSGSFFDTTARQTIKYGGVLYQDPNNPQAGGFFLGAISEGAMSGVVQLTAQ